MKTILGTKDDKYAQEQPHMPILIIKKGKEYSVSDKMADRICNHYGGATIVKGKIADTETEEEELNEEGSPLQPETKEAPRKKGKSKPKR